MYLSSVRLYIGFNWYIRKCNYVLATNTANFCALIQYMYMLFGELLTVSKKKN